MSEIRHGLESMQSEQLGEELSDQALVTAYLEGRVSDRGVVRRFLSIAGLIDRAEEALVRVDGSRITDDDGSPVAAQDYHRIWNNHGPAKVIILNSIAAGEAGRDQDTIEGMKALVNGYLSQPQTSPES